MTVDEYMADYRRQQALKKKAAKPTPRGYRVLINPEWRRFGGIGWRPLGSFSTRKGARAYVIHYTGNNKPNKREIKIEAVY